MNKNNYFGDITELFLEARQAEDIQVNAHAKASIREMLAYKIDQINVRNSENESGENFLSKWRYRLLGIPASIFAVLVVVMAVQNMQISMPKEDFTPAANDPVTFEEDIPVIEDVEEMEVRKLKPELLIIDYGESAPTSSAPTSSAPTSSSVSNATSLPSNEPLPSKPPIKTGGGLIEEPIPSVPQAVKTTTTQTTTNTNAESSGTTTGSTGTTATGTTTSTPTQPTTNYTMISLDPSEKQSENLTIPEKTPYLVTPNNNINTQTVQDQLVKTPAVKVDDGNSTDKINTYKPALLYQDVTFTEKALENIENPDNLSNVNVHYLNDSQAAVEVSDNSGSTRWYLFEDIQGNWAVTQKFD